jgi:hypothetical protein
MWQSGHTRLPGRGALPLGGHLEVMRLVLSHFLSVLPDIMSARVHKQVFEHSKNTYLLQ